MATLLFFTYLLIGAFTSLAWAYFDRRATRGIVKDDQDDLVPTVVVYGVLGLAWPLSLAFLFRAAIQSQLGRNRRRRRGFDPGGIG